MNRLQGHFEPERVPDADFFVISGNCSVWYVSAAMARSVEERLDMVPAPRWVTFVDLSGARVRLRARNIDSICQSTLEQRTADRDFLRSLRREREADRSFEDDA
jgi:hypothetical protein